MSQNTTSFHSAPIISPGNAGRRFDLLAFGDPNADYLFETERVPLADEKVLGRNLGMFPGGTVANVACAASLLGAKVASCGRVGNDPDGVTLLEDFKHFNVATDYVSRVSHRTASAMIVLNANGEKALVYSGMPGNPLEGDGLVAPLQASRVVYAMPYNLDSFRELSVLARENGTDVAIDIEGAVAPNFERLRSLLELSDIVFMNEGGFRASSRQQPSAEAIRPLLEWGPRIVVLTLGSAGAIAVTREAVAVQPAIPARLVDATGAGDCFNGAFLANALKGYPIDRCLAFGCAAASISISEKGARTALPTEAQVCDRLRQE